MKVILYQLDGSVPNIALMRVAAHHRKLGDQIELRWKSGPERMPGDTGEEKVYASIIFEKSRPLIERLLASWPSAIIGGTGFDVAKTLEEIGIDTIEQDYSIYPAWKQSIGFTQRGCRLKCGFCVVPKKEGAVRTIASIEQIWRGGSWPKELILLDNDFFGQEKWKDRIAEIRNGKFKVSFNQGINARFLTDEAAEAIATVNYRDDSMKVRRIYTAWDNQKDEARLFDGLNRLVKYGVKPDHVMVYMLIGYWPHETWQDREYRRKKLRDFGARPYPMPYVRTRELVGFQRWCIGAYDKRISWNDWVMMKYQPKNFARYELSEIPDAEN